ncbi:methyltransferase domain-containing protein, partial [Rhodoferax sp.]|uniref:class I SAM-dependent methyltransferase n=1 Tax=Rhodoferax sp. TaxID=50421 RepID=UPI00262D2CC2
MPNANSSQHVYQRTVSGDDSQDSLSIIASLIEPGQTLLDLGMGTGGLGQYLSQRFAIVADGVTLNPAEAELARDWYRQTRVADLDSANLSELFGAQVYDCIVCADVLEHLKAPEHVLAQCKALLKPGGRLIVSVPNAGYCGLIAELIQGEFRYRPEGLLDNTHLRFFTRQSLRRFLTAQGWCATDIRVTRRDLLASEFAVPFDGLPPAVARHLLALPDALTYQFV